MIPLRFIILSVLLTTFMGASDGMASTHNHESHDLGISSPFEKEQKRGELHCFLNNHQHGDKFCPHSKKLEKGEKHYLSAYCGGESTGTFPSFSFYKDNINNSYFISGLNNNSFLIPTELFLAAQQILKSQDPPPEIL